MESRGPNEDGRCPYFEPFETDKRFDEVKVEDGDVAMKRSDEGPGKANTLDEVKVEDGSVAMKGSDEGTRGDIKTLDRTIALWESVLDPATSGAAFEEFLERTLLGVIPTHPSDLALMEQVISFLQLRAEEEENAELASYLEEFENAKILASPAIRSIFDFLEINLPDISEHAVEGEMTDASTRGYTSGLPVYVQESKAVSSIAPSADTTKHDPKRTKRGARPEPPQELRNLSEVVALITALEEFERFEEGGMVQPPDTKRLALANIAMGGLLQSDRVNESQAQSLEPLGKHGAVAFILYSEERDQSVDAGSCDTQETTSTIDTTSFEMSEVLALRPAGPREGETG